METPIYYRISNLIFKGKSKKNIFFSPIAIRISLALAYLGADGNTAEEIKQALCLDSNTKDTALEEVHSFLQKLQTHGAARLKIFNRVFIDTKFKLNPNYNKKASFYLSAEAETIDFKDNSFAAETINDWVNINTESRMKDIISPLNINPNTSCVLVNANYFEGEWANKFDPQSTEKRYFTFSKRRHVEVYMMFQIDDFAFDYLRDLDGYGIEMQYKSSDLSMLVLLPRAVDGLASLERKLKSVDLIKLSKSLKLQKLHFGFPKFKFEYDISLQPILQQLGIKKMFLKSSDFSNLLRNSSQFSISDVKHKNLIEVNELGTKAETAAAVKFSGSCSFFDIRDFIVDHPFFFAIKDKENIYFKGHVARF